MNIEKLINETSAIYLSLQRLDILIKSTLENSRLDTFIKRVTLNLLNEPLENLKLQLDLLIDLQNSKSDEEIRQAVKGFSSKMQDSIYSDLLNLGGSCNQN